MRTHLEQCTGENKPPEVHPEEFFMGVDLKKDPDEAAGPCPERRTLDILKEQLGTYYVSIVRRFSHKLPKSTLPY